MDYVFSLEGLEAPSFQLEQAQLYRQDGRLLSRPIQAEVLQGRLQFPALQAGRYFLDLRYLLSAEPFDSFYFELEIPDITFIQVQLSAAGAQIQQLGFLNERGERVDMLIYENEKPWLTRPLSSQPVLQGLSHFLLFDCPTLPAAQARQQLNQLLKPLAESFPQLQALGAYQLKVLLQPELLAQTTASWKACLQHLLRNHLLLMDDEHLQEQLLEAIELAQQDQEVTELLQDLEWNPEQQVFDNMEQFLKNLGQKQILL